MLAIIYLALTFWIGDLIGRRFYRFISAPHRLAAAFLVGLLVSSWFTYLTARVFASATRPLLWGNFLFFVAVIGAFVWTRRREGRDKAPADNETIGGEATLSTTTSEENAEASPAEEPAPATPYSNEREVFENTEPEPKVPPEETVSVPTDAQDLARSAGSNWLDWVFVGVYLIVVCWLMFATLNSSNGKLQIGNNEFSDFGPNTAIMQTFAVGHNFPTEYPHFSGDRIRYHFLFYFQAGNLEFLGLDPAWSLNLLSLLSLVAMLILVMALGEVLFNSRAVGRLGSALFFFFGSLSYFPYLRKQGSVSAMIHAIANERAFLSSGFPYRGEDWGVWSLVVFLNQRHLAFAIAVVLLVLIFLMLQYRKAMSEPPAVVGGSIDDEATTSQPPTVADGPISDEATTSEPPTIARADETSEPTPSDVTPDTEEPTHIPKANPESFFLTSRAFIFSGALLGLLPMWNSAVFAAAAAVLAALFILFPLRKQMVMLAITAGLIALPQVIYLSTGNGRAPAPALFHWGYTLDHPTIWNVIKYLGFTFGFKWVLIAFALLLATRIQRRFFLAISVLLPVAFLLQLSVEVLANHKFLHIWIIIANLFVAYGLWRLWHLVVRGSAIPGKIAALIFTVLIILGGIIDLFPIHNAYWTEVTYKNDRLIEWLARETDPRAIFLTDRFVNHPILMAGRRVFYGWPYFAWSAGYRAGDRDVIYRQMWQERNPQRLLKLLQDNNISYVALDDGVRRGEFGLNMNEPIYRRYFPSVFQDGSLIIFKVPQIIAAPTGESRPPEETTPAVNMLTGGKGRGSGQFDWPRGITFDDKGNILVADTNNGRIQRFSADGVFISSIGTPGPGGGEFKEPCGLAVDRRGNIYVADFSNHRVQILKSDGSFIAQWQVPGDFAPRDLAVTNDNLVYVIDEAQARVVKFDRGGKILASWGSKGEGDGQFAQATSVAVDEKNNRVYVADPRNRRIVVFDTNGRFVGNWFIEEWRPIENAWYMHDLIVDSKAGRVYATSTQTDEVLVFDLAGTKIASLKPVPPDKLEGASSLTLLKDKLYIVDTFAARISRIDLSPTVSGNKERSSPK